MGDEWQVFQFDGDAWWIDWTVATNRDTYGIDAVYVRGERELAERVARALNEGRRSMLEAGSWGLRGQE